jgi:dipeptidyl aminopeptidase/acylaminoacyl peptidase
VKLYGELLVPDGVADPPLVVLVHGSEKTSPIGFFQQRLLAAQGIAVFAYDKRGTGRSAGVYTQDFALLADDAAAALAAARKLGAFRRAGLFGGSQGGWIAPLAALKAHADFVAVGFGVVGTAAEQDRWQVDYQLHREAGFGPEIDGALHEITDATATVARSDFKAGMDRVEALKAQNAGAPWLGKIDGQYSGELLRGELDRAREESPQVPWTYTGLDTLRALKAPQLWVMARDDDVAPSAPSIARLKTLKAAGKPIRIMVYPDTTHGIRRIHRDASGARTTSFDLAAGYLRLVADFAKGKVKGRYGDGVWVAR